MSKPRIFVSSTYYDLKHIRASLEAFIVSLGYESVLFESGDITFQHERALDLSCYEAVDSAHIFVLIIGGRYGSAASNQAKTTTPLEVDSDKMYEFYNSITVEEYRRARQKDIPIYIFLEKGVSAEYLTYRENRDLKTIKYAHVDNVSIFKLIDEIYSQHRNNLIRDFEKFEHITSWLRSQWAGLFADHLTKRKSDSKINDLALQIQTLTQVADALKSYSKAIVRKIEPDEAESNKIIKGVEDKLTEEVVLNNPFVRYLIRQKKMLEEKELDLNSIISATVKNDKIPDFIAELGFNDSSITRILKVSTSSAAKRDFYKLRQSLFEISTFRPLFSSPPISIDSEEENEKSLSELTGEQLMQKFKKW